jgi:hypothetical protein
MSSQTPKSPNAQTSLYPYNPEPNLSNPTYTLSKLRKQTKYHPSTAPPTPPHRTTHSALHVFPSALWIQSQLVEKLEVIAEHTHSTEGSKPPVTTLPSILSIQTSTPTMSRSASADSLSARCRSNSRLWLAKSQVVDSQHLTVRCQNLFYHFSTASALFVLIDVGITIADKYCSSSRFGRYVSWLAPESFL